MAKTPSISRTTVARVHKNHFRENLQYVRSLTTNGSFFCPMLKADAYGHGDIELSRVCDQEKVNAIGVISIEEAIRLRENKIQSPILVFGSFSENIIRDIEKNKITSVISDWQQLELFQKAKSKKPLAIHLKFNTGMNRKGFREEDLEKLIPIIEKTPNLKVEGVLTHLLNGEDILEPGYSQNQMQLLQKMLRPFEKYKPIVHAYNSAATLMTGLTKDKISIGVRPGIALYGYSSLKMKRAFPLKPVMQISSTICDIQKIRKGEVVSYGGTWKAARDSWIGIIPFGYADGYFRSLSNQAYMLVHGMKVPVVGTVCMDYCMLDVTNLMEQGVKPGDEVVILGKQGNEQITAEDIAQILKTIPYEILTSVGARIPRLYMENE
jgi:alanine racemase